MAGRDKSNALYAPRRAGRGGEIIGGGDGINAPHNTHLRYRPFFSQHSVKKSIVSVLKINISANL